MDFASTEALRLLGRSKARVLAKRLSEAGETDEMTKRAAIGRSLGWGVSAVVFGLLPVWTSLLLPEINREITFSVVELLKSGAIIIFSITLTISVLVDYYLSRFRYSSRATALWFNAFFPFAICLCGMLFHMATISTRSSVLNTQFVLNTNIGITLFAVLYCVIQKVLLLYGEEWGTE
jgi:hypothetical protein